MKIYEPNKVYTLETLKGGEVEVSTKVPIYDYADDEDTNGILQAMYLGQLPNIFHHVALMPDMHMGFGMPIGGVAALDGAVGPNLVGKDIGCGVSCAKLNIPHESLDTHHIVNILRGLRKRVPMGAGIVHKDEQGWIGFDERGPFREAFNKERPWVRGSDKLKWFKRSFGTLGGGKMIASSPRV